MAIKNTVSIDFYLRSSIVLAFLIAASPVCSSQFITGSTHIMGGYIYFPTVLIKFYYQCLCVSGHSGLHDQSVQMPLPAPLRMCLYVIYEKEIHFLMPLRNT